MDPIHNKEISVGDLVREHTKHSKKRVGLVHEVISNHGTNKENSIRSKVLL